MASIEKRVEALRRTLTPAQAQNDAQTRPADNIAGATAENERKLGAERG